MREILLAIGLFFILGCEDMEEMENKSDTEGYENTSEDAPAPNVITSSRALTIPSGFYSIPSASGTGVTLYRKDYAGGYPDYVTVIDLQYATVKSFTGTITGSLPLKSVYKGTDSSFWNTAKAWENTDRPLCVLTNGTFFDPNINPTGIAFGLKKDNAIVSGGYGYNPPEYPGLMRVIRLKQGTGALTYIMASNATTVQYSSSFPDVIGGLDYTVVKGSTWDKRTFVGYSGNYTMLLFNSYSQTRNDADTILKSFGATSTMMLDGGGSSFLKYRNSSGGSTTAYSAGRPIPHTIAVYCGR